MKTVVDLFDIRQERKRLAGMVGLVPTMGYLHQGHLSLVQRAKQECSSVIATIFVNPTQFGENEDLSAYPRDLPGDLDKFERQGVDLVWLPSVEIMYPAEYQTWVSVVRLSQRLEGEMRPDHFRGVATVVAKLFNATQPDKAYFGQKDAQQLIVIRRMVADLNFPLDVVACPTIREADGLAMSSRNAYLNQAERQATPILYHALSSAKNAFTNGERDAENLRQIVIQLINQEPLARLQYVSCADPHNLQELEGKISGSALISLAVYFGKTRLIDNVLLGEN